MKISPELVISAEIELDKSGSFTPEFVEGGLSGKVIETDTPVIPEFIVVCEGSSARKK
jgi:hypothetical protein